MSNNENKTVGFGFGYEKDLESEKETEEVISSVDFETALSMLLYVRAFPDCPEPNCDSCLWNAKSTKMICDRLAELSNEKYRSINSNNN